MVRGRQQMKKVKKIKGKNIKGKLRGKRKIGKKREDEEKRGQ